VAYDHHGPAAFVPEVAHPGEQVHDAIGQSVRLTVVQSQRRNALSSELLGEPRIGARARSFKAAKRPAHPDYSLVRIFSPVQYPFDVSQVSTKQQSLAGPSVMGWEDVDSFNNDLRVLGRVARPADPKWVVMHESTSAAPGDESGGSSPGVLRHGPDQSG
jgi:hypothetical protein